MSAFTSPCFGWFHMRDAEGGVPYSVCGGKEYNRDISLSTTCAIVIESLNLWFIVIAIKIPSAMSF